MHKFFKVLLFLLFLWVVSWTIASVFFAGQGFTFGENQIAVVPIHGMITLGGTESLFSTGSSANDIVAMIDDASSDDAIKGVVLDINSPGGTVMGSKRIADAVKKVDKPVVAVISETGTSGAYWIASQADVIVADELSLVGSIGVMGSYLEFGGLLEDYNVTYQRLVTGDYKDISTPFRAMSLEEEALIDQRLQGIHDYFVAEVARGRNMPVEDVEVLANGLFYLGQDAVTNGLVDEIGDQTYAINLTKQMAGVSDGDVVEYTEEAPFFDRFDRYLSYSSFYIGQGIGSVLFTTEASELDIHV